MTVSFASDFERGSTSDLRKPGRCNPNPVVRDLRIVAAFDILLSELRSFSFAGGWCCSSGCLFENHDQIPAPWWCSSAGAAGAIAALAPPAFESPSTFFKLRENMLLLLLPNWLLLLPNIVRLLPPTNELLLPSKVFLLPLLPLFSSCVIRA